MTEFEKVDTNGSGVVEKSEWDALDYEDRRRRLDDEDSKRDQQRKMVWFALCGMLLYPFAIMVTALGGLKAALSPLFSILAPIIVLYFFFSIAGIIKETYNADYKSQLLQTLRTHNSLAE